jgi:hypothetical protein
VGFSFSLMNDGANFLAGPTESQEKGGFIPTEEGFSAKKRRRKSSQTARQ